MLLEKKPEIHQSDLPTVETEDFEDESTELILATSKDLKEQKEKCGKKLDLYFFIYPYIKRSEEREMGNNDALVLFSDPKNFLDKERVRQGADSYTAMCLHEDLIDIKKQYQELIDILPKKFLKLIPVFGKGDWTDAQIEKFKESEVFPNEINLNAFINRVSALSEIYKQIEEAQEILNKEMIAKQSSKAKKAAVA